MGAVGIRMANDLSCKATAIDFVLPLSQRRLFPYVEPTYEPFSEDGFDIPQVQENIKKTLQHLFIRILGVSYPIDHPEIEEAYLLWLDLHQTGKSLIASGDEVTYLQWSCRGRTDPVTGEALPSDQVITYDENYTIRAWRGIIAYLLADYRFLFE